MTYQVASGFDQSGSLTDLASQPRLTGIESGPRRIAGSGLSFERGKQSGTLRYGFLTDAEYTALLVALGLTSAVSAKITLRHPQNDGRAFTNSNVIIHRPASPEFYNGRAIQGLEFAFTIDGAAS